ncbi:hypothetical protein PYCCODRAFT_1191269 [Trametes coccinea BRFM310]|uniref:Uncharacterized protein n=1 Tax=Trametes coccinea (strain BRFM310) TaxID=1353009 RepID=A0A1Y2I7Q2_TRAC3|nr:hypothetical protein PYCCODRAFT_1191269 [Trametes coccinea BRFM310]
MLQVITHILASQRLYLCHPHFFRFFSTIAADSQITPVTHRNAYPFGSPLPLYCSDNSVLRAQFLHILWSSIRHAEHFSVTSIMVPSAIRDVPRLPTVVIFKGFDRCCSVSFAISIPSPTPCTMVDTPRAAELSFLIPAGFGGYQASRDTSCGSKCGGRDCARGPVSCAWYGLCSKRTAACWTMQRSRG